jgi:hypothetical protein
MPRGAAGLSAGHSQNQARCRSRPAPGFSSRGSESHCMIGCDFSIRRNDTACEGLRSRERPDLLLARPVPVCCQEGPPPDRDIRSGQSVYSAPTSIAQKCNVPRACAPGLMNARDVPNGTPGPTRMGAQAPPVIDSRALPPVKIEQRHHRIAQWRGSGAASLPIILPP